MEPLYVHLAIWLFPVSKPNIQIQIETPFGKWQFHGSFSKYCELCRFKQLAPFHEMVTKESSSKKDKGSNQKGRAWKAEE